MTERSEALHDLADRIEALVADQQRDPDPAHEDFYDLASPAVRVLAAVRQLYDVLEGQAGHYGDHRILRSDNGRDPGAVLADACQGAAATRGYLHNAETTGKRYWSAIGHIGVEVARP